MDDNVLTLAHIRTHCPQCGRGDLARVRTADAVNLLCSSCGACWQVAGRWLCRVDPVTCSGCALRGLCVPEDPEDGDAAG